LIELLSTPLDAAGEGERVGPSDSEYWFGVPRKESMERDFLNSLLRGWQRGLAKRRATSCSTDMGNTETFVKRSLIMHIKSLKNENSNQINVWYRKNNNTNSKVQEL
jgi:hypothetical protein